MKERIKKLIAPAILISIGIGISIFIAVFNPQEVASKKFFTNKYIAIKIKDVYPFPLLFKKGTRIKNILEKFKISGSRKVFIKKKEINLKNRLYEDTTLSIS